MGDVIEVEGLVKRFGSFAALDGLDLTVAAGEVAGFLGPNGAGKSTTIRVLLGLFGRSGGTVRVFGADPFVDAVAIHPRLAYVPGEVSLWPQLTGGECIDVLLRLRGIDPTTSGRAEMIERFELDPTKRSSTYSDVGPGPADGPAVPIVRARGGAARIVVSVVEPHPQRGRGTV